MKLPRILLDHPFTERDVQRFTARVSFGAKQRCWEISGYPVDGYVQVRTDPHRKFQQAHRISYQLYVGDIPPGVLVLHTCDNRRCVNPSHLFLGSYQDNADDREEKGRGNQPKGSKNGFAKLTEADVVEIRRLYKKGVRGNTAMLMQRFGVGQYTIYAVGNYLGWRHVE